MQFFKIHIDGFSWVTSQCDVKSTYIGIQFFSKTQIIWLRSFLCWPGSWPLLLATTSISSRSSQAILNTSWTWISAHRNIFLCSSMTSWRRVWRGWLMLKLKMFWTNPWFCSGFCKKRTPLRSITRGIWRAGYSIKSLLQMTQRRWWSASSSLNVAVSLLQSLRACSKIWLCPIQ